jgi:hypothetical protein
MKSRRKIFSNLVNPATEAELRSKAFPISTKGEVNPVIIPTEYFLFIVSSQVNGKFKRLSTFPFSPAALK